MLYFDLRAQRSSLALLSAAAALLLLVFSAPCTNSKLSLTFSVRHNVVQQVEAHEGDLLRDFPGFWVGHARAMGVEVLRAGAHVQLRHEQQREQQLDRDHDHGCDVLERLGFHLGGVLGQQHH